MDKVTVSRAVARLLRNGRLTREFSSTDRRRSQLNLSARGRAVYRRIVPLAQAYETRLVAELSETECRTLIALLERLSA
jgi:DNA-binding MarR family transcriptional regulator